MFEVPGFLFPISATQFSANYICQRAIVGSKLGGKKLGLYWIFVWKYRTFDNFSEKPYQIIHRAPSYPSIIHNPEICYINSPKMLRKYRQERKGFLYLWFWNEIFWKNSEIYFYFPATKYKSRKLCAIFSNPLNFEYPPR